MGKAGRGLFSFLVAVVGLIASLIAIYTFATGIACVNCQSPQSTPATIAPGSGGSRVVCAAIAPAGGYARDGNQLP